MRIGLLGAAFDPPHLGHWQVTQTLLEIGLVDQVWWVPVQQHPMAKQSSPTGERLAMVEAALTDHLRQFPQLATKVTINQFELTQTGPSYSYLTLQALSQQHPTDQFTWIMGADNVAAFHKWFSFKQIATEYGVLIYPRPGYTMTPLISGMRPVTEVPEVAISSTLVRQRVAAGESIADLVSPTVAQYIKEHQLYQQSES